MSNNSDALIPNDEGTQSLNKMVAEIKSLKASVTALETKVDAKSKNTNANLLEAFAKMLEQTKLDFAEIVKKEIAQAKEEIKTEVKAEIAQSIKQELGNFMTEFKTVKKEVWRMHSNVLDIKANHSDLEDRVEKLESSSPNQ